jgi:hypothetical protein
MRFGVLHAGTVTNVREAVAWLGYTYMFVRMQRNPLAYGVAWDEVAADPRLDSRRRALVTDAARELERSKMARFDERSGNLYITELVRPSRKVSCPSEAPGIHCREWQSFMPRPGHRDTVHTVKPKNPHTHVFPSHMVVTVYSACCSVPQCSIVMQPAGERPGF